MMENTNILTFYDENNEELQLEIIDSFELSDKKYVALATPETETDNAEDSEVFIMRIESETSGEDIFVYIEDEEELNAAFDMFVDRCGEDYEILED